MYMTHDVLAVVPPCGSCILIVPSKSDNRCHKMNKRKTKNVEQSVGTRGKKKVVCERRHFIATTSLNTT